MRVSRKMGKCTMKGYTTTKWQSQNILYRSFFQKRGQLLRGRGRQMVDVVMGRDKCQEQCLLSLPLSCIWVIMKSSPRPRCPESTRKRSCSWLRLWNSLFNIQPPIPTDLAVEKKRKYLQCFIKYCRGIRNFPVSCRHTTKEEEEEKEGNNNDDKVMMKQNPKPKMKSFSNPPSEEDPGLAQPSVSPPFRGFEDTVLLSGMQGLMHLHHKCPEGKLSGPQCSWRA